MLEALDDSQRAQRQLVADASHELRTPLTTLRTNIEVLRHAGALPDGRPRAAARPTSSPSSRSSAAGRRPRRAGARRRAHGEPHEPLRLDELVAAAVERARRHAPGVAFETDLEPCVVDGRARPARPRGRQPARQRGQVEPAGRHGRGRAARRRADRPRPRPRHRAGGPPARLRPLLPRRRGARARRLGPRAGDRPPGRRGPRRRGHRRAGARRRRAPAAGAAGLSSDSYLSANRLSGRSGSIGA